MQGEAKDTKGLTEIAIEELERLLKDDDKEIRLKAISLILRHDQKLKKVKTEDDDSDPFGLAKLLGDLGIKDDK